MSEGIYVLHSNYIAPGEAFHSQPTAARYKRAYRAVGHRPPRQFDRNQR